MFGSKKYFFNSCMNLMFSLYAWCFAFIEIGCSRINDVRKTSRVFLLDSISKGNKIELRYIWSVWMMYPISYYKRVQRAAASKFIHFMMVYLDKVHQPLWRISNILFLLFQILFQKMMGLCSKLDNTVTCNTMSMMQRTNFQRTSIQLRGVIIGL